MIFRRKRKPVFLGYVALHTSDPGTASNPTGAPEIGQRSAVTWSAANCGEIHGETITHIALWDAAVPKRSRFHRVLDIMTFRRHRK